MRNMLIYAKYLQKYDVFRESNNRPGAPHIALEPHRTVLEIREVDDDELFGECNPPVKMRIRTAEGVLELKEGAAVELLHRPHPKGETRASMLDKAKAFASGAPDGTVTVTIYKGGTHRERLAQVREAIEAYELGLPIEEPKKAVS